MSRWDGAEPARLIGRIEGLERDMERIAQIAAGGELARLRNEVERLRHENEAMRAGIAAARDAIARIAAAAHVADCARDLDPDHVVKAHELQLAVYYRNAWDALGALIASVNEALRGEEPPR